MRPAHEPSPARFLLSCPSDVPRPAWYLVLSCLLAACRGYLSDAGGDLGRDGPTTEDGSLSPPGPRLHRLNRLEYDNTVRDLLGIRFRPAAAFPPDAASSGLDNLAEHLTLTPTLLSAYYDAARRVVDDALDDQPSFVDRTVAADLPVDGSERVGSYLALRGHGVTLRRSVPETGPVDVVFIAGGPFFGQDLVARDLTPHLRFVLDGTEVATVPIRGGAARAVEHVFSVELDAGEHTFDFVPTDYVNEPASGYGNNVNVEAIELRGPLAEAPGRSLVYVCDPAPPAASALVDVRRHVPNPAAFAAWRFEGTDIAHVPDAGAWEAGPTLPARPRLFQTPGDSRVFLVDVAPDGSEIKRHIPNPASFGTWRFVGGDIEPLSAAERDALPLGPPWPQDRRLVQADTPHVYTLDVAERRRDPAEYDVDCYAAILTTFAGRAWRRPLEPAEEDDLVARWTDHVRGGESADGALRLSLRRILIAPDFLYRHYEPELEDYWLASRLSYFLWSSTPDAALLDAAARGALRSDEGLRAEVRRMLDDPKSQALLDGFAEQWLSTRRLAQWIPDETAFPDATDPALRVAMQEEAKAFFGGFLASERPAVALLDADFAVSSDRLARHYGRDPVGSEAMAEVAPSEGRASILSLSGWLSLHVKGEHSSPIQRGRWIADHVLCDPVPPPPAGLEIGEIEFEDGLSKREQLEQHRGDPVCASCHERLDVVGMGFEVYDAVGRFRAEPGLDSLGELPSGETFEGAEELAAVLDPEVFASCLTQWLYAYALGRSVVPADEPSIDAIASDAVSAERSLRQILEAIALSDAFRATDGGTP